MRYGLLDMLGLAPFDPQKNTPAQLPGGMEATEYTANTGSRLPRFATREEADAYANKRSSAGGGKRGGIADIK